MALGEIVRTTNEKTVKITGMFDIYGINER